MKVFYIDLTGLDSKQELRDYLTAKLPLPDYCGSALDSYYDVLTEFGADWDIIFYNVSKIHGRMDSYVEKFQKMCRDAAAGTPGLRIRFYP